MLTQDIEDKRKAKLHTGDRLLVLRVKGGEKPRTTKGLMDSRLFTGENNLHVKVDPTSLWRFEYDSGQLPLPLKQKFTSFNAAYDFVERYFVNRNIEIAEVRDV